MHYLCRRSRPKRRFTAASGHPLDDPAAQWLAQAYRGNRAVYRATSRLCHPPRAPPRAEPATFRVVGRRSHVRHPSLRSDLSLACALPRRCSLKQEASKSERDGSCKGSVIPEAQSDPARTANADLQRTSISPAQATASASALVNHVARMVIRSGS